MASTVKQGNRDDMSLEQMLRTVWNMGAILWMVLVAWPAWGAGQQVVTVMQGAVLCANYGDIVVFANSGGSMMPSCQRLAQDTRAIQVDTGNGVARIHATGDTTIYYTLAASVSRR